MVHGHPHEPVVRLMSGKLLQFVLVVAKENYLPGYRISAKNQNQNMPFCVGIV